MLATNTNATYADNDDDIIFEVKHLEYPFSVEEKEINLEYIHSTDMVKL